MLSKLRHLLLILIGDFSWNPPSWLARPTRAGAAWTRAHRRATALSVLLAIALAAGGWWLRDWYRRQPKPRTIHVVAQAPSITPFEKDAAELKPLPLTIYFSESVAKLDQIGKPVTTGLRLDPPAEGVWKWEKDTQLVFQPKNDWPANRKYQVVLDRALFPAHVLLDHYEVTATTPLFTAKIASVEFYIDPKDPATKQVVATLTFSHRVEVAELQKRINAAMIGDSDVFKSGVPRFTLTAGTHNRVAYLRTSALTLPEREDFMRVTLAKGLPTTRGGAQTTEDAEEKVRIPDVFSLFKISSVKGNIIRNNEGEPEQVLFIEGSAAAKSEDIAKSMHVFLLPKRQAEKSDDDGDGKDAKDTKWGSPEEIDEEVLKKATELPVKLVPSGKELSEMHTFKIALEADGQLYVTIAKGARALGGFLLGEEYSTVLPVPVLPREVTIQGDGGVLALSGERKLAIKSRGVATIEYEIARVPADQINHLVSQTRGEFQSPEFINYHFDEENIARLATEKQSINLKSKFKANYSAFDFAKHLQPATDGGSAMQGLFFITARAWQPPKKKAAKDDANADAAEEEENASSGDDDSDGDEDKSDVSDRRFILVTDLGIIVKQNGDGGRDVFIASIKTGEPLREVAVEVLGENGVPLVTGTTDGTGHVTFASLGKPTHEKTPVAFVARRGNDVAFMPYSRDDRKLDFSRFDIGGVESRSGADLDAFVFTERGIYRPGDEIHIGLIVKQRNWAGKLDGLPVETEIVDARGTSVQVRKLALPQMGFAETSYQTAYESPTGVYEINVYLVRNGKRDTLLGSTSVNVKEFLPDRMKIESHLSKDSAIGWVTPDDVCAAIGLHNLYGTPATARRVKAHLLLTPSAFRFDTLHDYTFFDRLHDGKEDRERQTIDLGEQKTDDQGAATFELQLERFADATFALGFYVEGFEADGGRSVATSNHLLVSSLPYVVGTKPDGDCSYVPMASARSVEFIAVDPALKRVAVQNLECRLIERTYVSVLAKKDDGNWAYESVLKESVIRTEPVTIPADGLKYTLPTNVPGSFVLDLHEQESGARVGKVEFSVVGRGAVSRSLDKNAELQVKLSRPQYNTGEEIELSIVAPYTGSGLITIERDKVYAHAWFKADRTSTVQHIRVPADFEGTGYVNVCFVRALDSREVFMSPLSYAAVPFKANIEQRRLPVTLRAAAKAIPGEPLRIGYKTDRPARIAIFAVDQGILQVSDYHLPDPLARFFRKAALMVETTQIVDLILPEYSILRAATAFGGDGEDKHLNPFKRVTEKPVVFWSGIVDAEPREREVIYDVPDYFSGTLTIMAVAVAPDAVGSTQMDSLIRGPFVITPNVPTVAAPGDVFDVSVTVANGVEGSGENAEVRVTAEPSEHLEIVHAPTPLRIPEGREISATFSVRAKEKFGSASLLFRAATGGQESKLRSTLSVRPAVPFMTTVHSGNFTKDSTELKIERTIHPDFRKLDATVSALPLGLARGLDAYLKNYPNGCSEQLASGSFCRLLLADEADFGLTKAEINAQLERTFATLRRRQNDQGSFGYWAADNNEGIDFVSTYVMQFLVEAKDAGFAPPANIFQAGLKHLQTMVVLDPRNLDEARIEARAIYLLTREGIITTNYILNLRDYLEKNYEKQWTGDLTAVYLAGAYDLLKKHDDAQRLIKGYKFGVHKATETSDFHSSLIADAQYIAIVARHFPDTLKRITAADFQAIVRPVSEGEFNTLSAAYAVLALKSYSYHLAQNAPELSILEITKQKREMPLHMEGGALLKRALFSPEAAALRFTAKNSPRGMGAYFQVVEAGYDAVLPEKSITDGLEIIRDFLDAKGEVTHTARLGDPVTVRLRVRSLQRENVTNVAIVDLLPGAFELAAGSLQPGVGAAGCDYVEVREDRVVFFTTITPRVRELTYQIKPTNRGQFVVPPIYAESMYDRSLKGRGLAEKIAVTDAQ